MTASLKTKPKSARSRLTVGGAPSRKKKTRAARVVKGGAFATGLMDRGGRLAVDLLSKTFLITKTSLAETAGLPRDAVYKPARVRAVKTQARLGEMVEILRRVEGWAGGPRQAMLWYKSEPIPAFGGRTPEALVKNGYAASLRDYLDAIGTGGYA